MNTRDDVLRPFATKRTAPLGVAVKWSDEHVTVWTLDCDRWRGLRDRVAAPERWPSWLTKKMPGYGATLCAERCGTCPPAAVDQHRAGRIVSGSSPSLVARRQARDPIASSRLPAYGIPYA